MYRSAHSSLSKWPRIRRVVVNRMLKFLPHPVRGHHGGRGRDRRIARIPSRPPASATSGPGPLTAAALLVIVLLPDEADASSGTRTRGGKRMRGTARPG